MAEIVDGSLFDSPEQFIVHQCNCVTRRAKHLAWQMFRRFPFADVYATRSAPDTPGTIRICGKQDQRRVIAFFAQYFPGTASALAKAIDTSEARERYFVACLAQLAAVPALASVAFPWGIGCGAAGGDWEHYRRMIDDFARANKQVRVLIYRLAPAQATKRQQ